MEEKTQAETTSQQREGLKEIRFTFQHDGCWIQETTERHPSLLLVASSLYLNGDDVVMDLTAHAPSTATIEAAWQEWSEDPRILLVNRLHVGSRGSRFHVRYRSERSIYRYILEHTPVSIGTFRFAGGIEHYELIGSAQELQDLVKTLGLRGRLVVRSVRDVEPSMAASFSDDAFTPWRALTDKQLEALVVAYGGGYYNWPREASASALAGRMGLSSSSYLDHLRHAEAKLLSAMVDKIREADAGRIEALLKAHDIDA